MTLRPLTWIVLGLAALAAAIFFLFDPGVEGGVDDLQAASITREAETGVDVVEEPLAPTPLSEDRAVLAELAEVLAAPAAPTVAPEPEMPLRVRGVVLDLQGAPVAHVEVGVDRHSARAFSDFFGQFELLVPCDALGHDLEIVTEDLVALRTSYVAEEREHLLVVCPSLTLAGRTVDRAGTAVSRVALVVQLAQDLLHDFPRALDATKDADLACMSDGEGRFQLEVPAVKGWLGTSPRSEYSAANLALPESDRSDLELVLYRQGGPKVTGLVLLHDRTPAPGATVRLGDKTAVAGDDGAFAVAIEDDLAPEAILAAGLDGHAPALLERYGEVVLGARPAPPPPVELVLGPDLSIRGRVVDASGAPCAGWIAFLADGTPIQDVRAESLDWVNGPRWYYTDAQGNFAIGSLLERIYVVGARDPRTLLEIESEPIPAGTQDVLLRVGGDLLHSRVTGRVLSRRGAPLDGVVVQVCRTTYRHASGSMWIPRDATARTDELGRFQLADVPREGVFFWLAGDAIIPQPYEPESGYDPDALDIHVARRVHFRVTVRGSTLPRGRIELRDAAGATTPIHHFEANLYSQFQHLAVEERSKILSTEENAAELVVLSGDTVIAHVPLALDPDLEVNEIEVDLTDTR